MHISGFQQLNLWENGTTIFFLPKLTILPEMQVATVEQKINKIDKKNKKAKTITLNKILA